MMIRFLMLDSWKIFRKYSACFELIGFFLNCASLFVSTMNAKLKPHQQSPCLQDISILYPALSAHLSEYLGGVCGVWASCWLVIISSVHSTTHLDNMQPHSSGTGGTLVFRYKIMQYKAKRWYRK